MKVLTREQAIKRIEDILKSKNVDHIHSDFCIIGHRPTCEAISEIGAINELMAIFDIKEEELK